jgi:hypothetical protein
LNVASQTFPSRRRPNIFSALDLSRASSDARARCPPAAMAAPAPSEADETTVSLLDVAAPVDDAPNSETPPPKTRRLYVLVDWRHRDRAFDVLATDGDGARAWRGTAREPANAPFPDWHERAVMALAGIDATERFAFEFAFGDDDGALRWRWHEAAGAQISNAATTTISTPPPPPARVASG